MDKWESNQRLTPAWNYRPGADVADVPPPGLIAVQQIAKTAAMTGLNAAAPGISEKQIELAISNYLYEQGVSHVWTITNVGVGENAKICFPTYPPTDLTAKEQDVLIVDVHPIMHNGFWGDCSRCKVIGEHHQAQLALDDLEKIHYELLQQCRPAMRANELFSLYAERLKQEGYILLDALGNIGHSLSAGAAYLQNFIDIGNDTPMWAAWAVEPFVSREGIAVKVEDVVWFGREQCFVL